MDEILYQSKSQMKRLQHVAEQQSFLKERKAKEALQRWEQAQISAAGFQSVLDYSVAQYNLHKEDLEEEVITKTEQLIKERQEDIEKFLMTEKDLYLENMGIQAD